MDDLFDNLSEEVITPMSVKELFDSFSEIIEIREKEKVLTTLSFSAGEQSVALLHMILNDYFPVPRPFLVINADPGMEDERTKKFILKYEEECKAKEIDFCSRQ